MDLVFLVDRSGSINDTEPASGSGSNWHQVVGFMVNFTEYLEIGPTRTQVSVASVVVSAVKLIVTSLSVGAAAGLFILIATINHI